MGFGTLENSQRRVGLNLRFTGDNINNITRC